MGRELQKKKNRSSISKVRQKPKSKKLLLSHPVIAANYDKSQTLVQNYRRLGLTAKLNKTTGGVEKKLSDVLRERDGEVQDTDQLNISSSTKHKKELDVREAEVVRDPATGKILRILENDPTNSNPLNDPLNELDSESESEFLHSRNQHGNTNSGAQEDPSEHGSKTETVMRLEAEANKPAYKYKRRQPQGEIDFVEELVKKYGDDYGKMSRDLKINYMQRSEGDIKRRVRKWRDNGGTV